MRARLFRIPLFVFSAVGLTAGSAVLGAVLSFPGTASAQSGYANPFDDYEEEARQNQQPVYNGLADAAAALFGPEQATVQQAPVVQDPWVDLKQVDPNGQYGASYDDFAAQKVDRVVKAPLNRKQPFGSPLDDFKKDSGVSALFEQPRSNGGLSE